MLSPTEAVALVDKQREEIATLKERVRELEADRQQEYTSLLEHHEVQTQELQEENQRLREALEKITTHGIYCSDTNELDSCDVMQSIAREALGQKED